MPAKIFGEQGTRPIDRSGVVNSANQSQLVMSMWDNRAEAWVWNPTSAEGPSLFINIYSAQAHPTTPGNLEIRGGSGWSGYVTGAISIVASFNAQPFMAGER